LTDEEFLKLDAVKRFVLVAAHMQRQAQMPANIESIIRKVARITDADAIMQEDIAEVTSIVDGRIKLTQYGERLFTNIKMVIENVDMETLQLKPKYQPRTLTHIPKEEPVPELPVDIHDILNDVEQEALTLIRQVLVRRGKGYRQGPKKSQSITQQIKADIPDLNGKSAYALISKLGSHDLIKVSRFITNQNDPQKRSAIYHVTLHEFDDGPEAELRDLTEAVQQSQAQLIATQRNHHLPLMSASDRAQVERQVTVAKRLEPSSNTFQEYLEVIAHLERTFKILKQATSKAAKQSSRKST
jgi:hypothetical protein